MAPRSRSGSYPGRALAGLAVLILVMLLSITGKQTFSPGNWHSQFKVGLGLDLSSGTEIVLQGTTNKGAPSSQAMQQAITVLEARVNGTGNSGAQVQQTSGDQITVTVPGKAAPDVQNEVSTTAKLAFRPVLLWQAYSAPSASASASATAAPSASASASPSASAGASSSPSPPASGSASASAKASAAAYSARLAPAASASPSSSARASATAKASASAKSSASAKASATPKASATASPSAAAATTSYGNQAAVNAATLKLFDKLVCTPNAASQTNTTQVNDSWKATVGYTDALDQWDKSGQIVSCDSSGNKYVLDSPVVLGTQVTGVSAGIQQNSTEWVVNLTLDSAAAKSFGVLTTRQYNDYYPNVATNQDDAILDQTAIVLDGSVTEAPQTEGALTSGSFTISGPSGSGFTQAQATQLVNILKYGSLPINFQQVQIQSISPQVGRASLDAGLIAGILGLVLVIVYLFYYYRGLGLVSVSSLLLAALLAYLSVVLLSRYENFTMSLSAIAGLVVAIGITADSFIVYFERLRDEVREGKTLRPAVEAGWKRARRTILVSDTVSFIAAVLLYHFATSDVQGFAYTLGLTTLIDVVIVFLFTKPAVTLLAGTRFFSSGNKWSGLDPERLGAKARWRASTTRTVRTQRSSGPRPPHRTPTSRED